MAILMSVPQVPSALHRMIQGYQSGQMYPLQRERMRQLIAGEQAKQQQAAAMAPLTRALTQAQTGAIPLRQQAMMMSARATMLRALQAQKAQKEKPTAGQAAFQKAQGERFSKELGGINDLATNAKENEIPLYKGILSLVNRMNVKTGPGGTLRQWTQPDMQRLNALLTRAVFENVKNIHLGRWTQTEIGWLRNAVGNPNMMGSVLKDLFQQKLNAAQNLINKQQFYYNYKKGGGTDPDQVAYQWNQKDQPTDYFYDPTTATSGQQAAHAAIQNAVTSGIAPYHPGLFERLGQATGLWGTQQPQQSQQPQQGAPGAQGPTQGTQVPYPQQTTAPQGGGYSSVLGRAVTNDEIQKTSQETGDSIGQVKQKMGIQ